MIGNWFQRSERQAVRPGYGIGHYDEHAGSAQRRIGVGLALVAGASVAAALALTATSPVANADNVDFPFTPTVSGPETDQETFGVQPLFYGNAYEQNGTYVDLLGDDINTATSSTPLSVDNYGAPSIDPSIYGVGYSDSYGTFVAVQPGGQVGGSSFASIVDTSPITNTEWVNLYEDTPFYPTGGVETDNVNDVLLYEEASSINFGIQYLDLPDAATPVDELNFFGSSGDILFSIPVTGDLLSSL
jgi:hypothetical protein